jgi:hypothetical protein
MSARAVEQSDKQSQRGLRLAKLANKTNQIKRTVDNYIGEDSRNPLERVMQGETEAKDELNKALATAGTKLADEGSKKIEKAISDKSPRGIKQRLNQARKTGEKYTGEDPLTAIQRISDGESNLKDELNRGFDNTINNITPELEKITSRELKNQKQKASSFIPESDKKFIKELKTTGKRIGDLERHESTRTNKLRAYYEGVRLAYILRTDIAKDDFSGLTFIFVLTLSVVKDLVIDVPSTAGEVGTAGIAAILTTVLKGAFGLGISGFLMFFYLGRSSIIKRWLITRAVGSFFIEIIPGISLIPSYVLMAIFLKLKIEKKNSERKQKIEKLEAKNKKLEREL